MPNRRRPFPFIVLDFPRAFSLDPQAIGACMLFAGLVAALTSCGTAPAEPTVDATKVPQAQCNTTVVLGKVGALAKTDAISLSKLIIVGVSAATPPDTIRDTSTVSGNSQVTVTRTFTLKPLRNWTFTATSKDSKDSVVHQGSTAAFYVKPADTAVVSLSLVSRFAMYQANFNTLPDSIASATAGTGKDVVKFKRLVMKLDGVIKADSSASAYYPALQTVSLYFDYVGIGSHAVVLEAYGDVNTATNTLLYTGTTTFTVSAGTDDTKSVTLGWVGPTTGSSKISVTLGKVGKINVNGTLPGTVLLKGAAQ
jgi:hypothetical protein